MLSGDVDAILLGDNDGQDDRTGSRASWQIYALRISLQIFLRARA